MFFVFDGGCCSRFLETQAAKEFFKIRLPCIRIAGENSVTIVFVRGKLYKLSFSACLDKFTEPFPGKFGTPIAIILAV